MTARGEICWFDFGAVDGTGPAKRRPVVVVQNDLFTRSALATTLVVAITSNLGVAEYPGNVLLPASVSGLQRDSVANVTQIATVDESALVRGAGIVPDYLLEDIDRGLRLVLAV